MELTVQKFQIELLNLVEQYKSKGIPTYTISGIIAQELLRVKNREIAELAVANNNKIIDLTEQLNQAKGVNDGQGVSEPD